MTTRCINSRSLSLSIRGGVKSRASVLLLTTPCSCNFWSSRGAGVTPVPLLPKTSAAVALNNVSCQKTSKYRKIVQRPGLRPGLRPGPRYGSLRSPGGAITYDVCIRKSRNAVVISCTTQHFSHFGPSAFGIFPRVDVTHPPGAAASDDSAYARRQSTGFDSSTGAH